MPNPKKKFKIGLCMAGAISAGAYTAGAIDYLIEVLEEWQRRKDNNEPNTPSHDVEISVIGGASAGGMTGVIVASVIQDKIEPIRKLEGDIFAQKPNNKFYHSWVDLTGDDMLKELLKTDDISKNGLKSVLNSNFIKQIADREIMGNSDPVIKRKYIADNLKLFVTLSNLEGMKYSTTFMSNSPKANKYYVASHNDYVCFKLCDSENDYTDDGWIPLNFKTGLNTETAKDAAMATGAFPVGLEARVLSRDVKYMNDHPWFKHITQVDEHQFKQNPYETVNVDGGMINNEPFDKIRELLVLDDELKKLEEKLVGKSTEKSEEKIVEKIEEKFEEKINKMQDHNEFESTILMIDPFPSHTDKFDKSTNLSTIIGNTLGAMIGQARAKPSLVADTLDANKTGQFLIAPVRYENLGKENELKIEGKNAIACGSLDGFGGFVSKEFRIHDYFLGRANCEKLLNDYFTVPIDTKNEIFIDGYSQVTDKSRFIVGRGKKLQIIPIFTEMAPQPYMPQFTNNKIWPTVPSSLIYAYRNMIKKRTGKVIFNVTEFTSMQRLLLWIGAKVIINGKIADAVIKTIYKSLDEHKSIEN